MENIFPKCLAYLHASLVRYLPVPFFLQILLPGTHLPDIILPPAYDGEQLMSLHQPLPPPYTFPARATSV